MCLKISLVSSILKAQLFNIFSDCKFIFLLVPDCQNFLLRSVIDLGIIIATKGEDLSKLTEILLA